MAEQALVKILSQAIPRGFEALETPREVRRNMLRHLSGNRYGQNSNTPVAPRPLSLINQAVSTLIPLLAWTDPKIRCKTNTIMYRPAAETLAAAANHVIEEIRFNDTLRMILTDSFFGPGIAKVGVCPDYRYESPKGYLHDPGQVFFDRVSLDHYVIDPDARCREEALFEGDRYRVPREWALASGRFDNALLEKLDTIKEKDPKMAESLSNMGIASRKREGEVEYVYLVDVWLPASEMIACLAAPFGHRRELPVDEILSLMPHNGPEAGPYEMLGYQWEPDNVLPIPPASIWYEMADAGETVMRAVVKKAKRQKDLLAYEKKAERDAIAISEADDDDRVAVDDLNAVQLFQWGGVDDKTLDALAVIIEQFSRVSGNTEQLGGIKSNESTATQAEILASNAQVRVGDMRNIVTKFVQRQCKKIVWHIFTDPLFSMKVVKRVMGVEVELVYDESVREGDWLDYNIEVVASSTRPQDPQTAVRAFMEWMRDLVLPSIEVAQLTGGLFNPLPIIRKGADLMEIEGLDEIWPDPMIVQEKMAAALAGPDPAMAQMAPGGAPGGAPGQPGVDQPGGMGSRGTRLNRQDGPRDRSLRSGAERGDDSKTINRTRGQRLQR